MIFLVDATDNKVYKFDTEEEAEYFCDKEHEKPWNLTAPKKYYFDGGGSNGQTSTYCYGHEDNLQYVVSELKLTNNEAEYQGLIKCLENAETGSIIIGDSKLIINQVMMKWKCNKQHLETLRNQAIKLLHQKNCKLHWVRRKNNLAGIKIEQKKNLRVRPDTTPRP